MDVCPHVMRLGDLPFGSLEVISVHHYGREQRTGRVVGDPSSGFTLIELMIVVAIIAIVLAIAIPSLASARKSANESSAISSMRSLTSVMTQYRTRFGVFAPGLGALQASGYLSGFEPDGTGFFKSGYLFKRRSPPNLEWAFDARAKKPGTTGDRNFWVDSTGVIRWQPNAPAGPFSALLDSDAVAAPPPPEEVPQS